MTEDSWAGGVAEDLTRGTGTGSHGPRGHGVLFRRCDRESRCRRGRACVGLVSAARGASGRTTGTTGSTRPRGRWRLHMGTWVSGVVGVRIGVNTGGVGRGVVSVFSRLRHANQTSRRQTNDKVFNRVRETDGLVRTPTHPWTGGLTPPGPSDTASPLCRRGDLGRPSGVTVGGREGLGRDSTTTDWGEETLFDRTRVLGCRAGYPA